MSNFRASRSVRFVSQGSAGFFVSQASTDLQARLAGVDLVSALPKRGEDKVE